MSYYTLLLIIHNIPSSTHFHDFLAAKNILFNSLRTRGYTRIFLRNFLCNFIRKEVNKSSHLYLHNTCTNSLCTVPPHLLLKSSYLNNFRLQENLHCNLPNLFFTVYFNECKKFPLLFCKDNFHANWFDLIQEWIQIHTYKDKCDLSHTISKLQLLQTTNHPGKVYVKWDCILNNKKRYIICPVMFSDKSKTIKNIFTVCLSKLQAKFPEIYSGQSVLIAHKRNKNILDTIVSAKLL